MNHVFHIEQILLSVYMFTICVELTTTYTTAIIITAMQLPVNFDLVPSYTHTDYVLNIKNQIHQAVTD